MALQVEVGYTVSFRTYDPDIPLNSFGYVNGIVVEGPRVYPCSNYWYGYSIQLTNQGRLTSRVLRVLGCQIMTSVSTVKVGSDDDE